MADSTLTGTAVKVDNLVIEAGEVVKRTIKTGQTLTRAMLLTLEGTRLAAVAVAGTNTGDGVVSGETASDLAEVGTYTFTCTATAANAGTFSVFSPSGIRLADLTVAVAYDGGHIALTIADGATDFALADSFTVAVTEVDGVLVKTVAGGNIDAIVKDDITTVADTVANVYYTGVYLKSEIETATGITITEAMQDSARVNKLMVGTR